MTGGFLISLIPSKGSSHADLVRNAFPANCCQFLNEELKFRNGTRFFYVSIVNWTPVGLSLCLVVDSPWVHYAITASLPAHEAPRWHRNSPLCFQRDSRKGLFR